MTDISGRHATGAARRSGTTRRRLAAAVAISALAAAGCSTDSADPVAAPSGSSVPADAGSTAMPITRAAVDASFGELDQIVESALAETGVPGAAVAVVFDDEVVYTNGYGVKNTETGDPVDAETIFQIASLSKPVSSTVMAGAVGKGTFAWDDPIVDYAPEFALSDPWVTDHVTFADLFSHRSGLPGASAGNDLESIGYDRTTILERLDEIPLNPFRITYSYSNFGMSLGGEAAAIASGTSWDELANDVLFEPAGMTSTSMNEADFRAADNTADLHAKIGDDFVPAFERHPDPQAPAGGVSSNVGDLGRWVRLQLNGGELDGTQIIDEDALDQTHIPATMSRPPMPTIADHASHYGLGWNVAVRPDGAVEWNHSGAFSTGTGTTATLLPADGFGIVTLTNGAPIGVPESINASYIEYLTTGSVTTDWLGVWTERMAGLLAPRADWSTPPADAAPARDDAAYVGTYANNYVGEVEVRATDSGLELVMGPDDMAFPLEHWDDDTFVYLHYEEIPDDRETATFEVGDDGVATSVTISAFEGSTGLGVLNRV